MVLMDSTEKTENRIDWIRRKRVLVKDRCFYLRWSILQELFRYVWACFGVLIFAILLVILIAECVASKGSFSGVVRIVVLLILISLFLTTAQFRYTSGEGKP